MSEIKQLQERQHETEKQLALHNQMLDRLVHNESTMTKVLEAVHESNTSVKLLSRDMSICQRQIEKASNHLALLQSWKDNVDGASKSANWLMRHGATIVKIIFALVVLALVAEGYFLSSK